MFDGYELLLLGTTPLGFAMLGFGIGWAAARRPAVAWPMGVILGYAAGSTALEARGTTVAAALETLIHPREAYQWVTLVGLLSVGPSVAGAMLARRRLLRWTFAAGIAATAPAWLLWGGKYLPSRDVRESGFATSAWDGPQAVLILAGVAALMLAAWYLWEAADSKDSPRVRSLLAVITFTGGAAVIGLTGTFVYAQLFGVLAASLGGCFIAAWLLKAPTSPEDAAGPTITIAGALLLLATCYSELHPLQAAGVWASIVLAAGWIPGLARVSGRGQLAARAIACLLPLIVVLSHAATVFAETQRQQQEERDANPYLNL
jgi:hypothetical protein